MHYHTWSGYDAPDLFKAYIEKYGGMPEVSLIATEEESFTKLKTGWAPDLIHPGNYNVRRFKDAGLLQPFDTARVKNWASIIDSVKTDDFCIIDGAQYMIPSEYGNSSIVYRKDLVDPSFAANPSWGILYDEKYKGKLSNYGTAAAVVQCAALVLGYDNIYTLSDEQLAEVKKLASKQRDMLRMYWNDATELEGAIASGEVVAAYAWNASLANLKKQGIDVEIGDPEGAHVHLGRRLRHAQELQEPGRGLRSHRRLDLAAVRCLADGELWLWLDQPRGLQGCQRR